MSEPRGLRDLNRLKWVTIVLPIVFVWGFELVRFLVLDPQLTSDESHVAAALIMGAAIVVFAMIVSVYLDRAQRQLVSQNKDLTATHAVSSAVRGGLSLPDLLEQSPGPRGHPDRRPGRHRHRPRHGRPPHRDPAPRHLAPGLAWLTPLLAEPLDSGRRRCPALQRAGPASTPASSTCPLIRARTASATCASPSTRPSSPTSRTPPSPTSRARSPAPPSWA